jgi:hypothetical protein
MASRDSEGRMWRGAAIAFPRTTRSLGRDRSGRALVLFAVAVALLGGWGGWLCLARVEISSMSGAASDGGGAGRVSPAMLLWRGVERRGPGR